MGVEESGQIGCAWTLVVWGKMVGSIVEGDGDCDDNNCCDRE